MDVVVTGYAGFDGSLTIYQNKECRERLLRNYSKSFLGVLEKQTPQPLVPEKLSESAAEGLSESAADGGVLAALWRLLKRQRSGGTYALSEIPVLQQTIEICETFALNPYRLSADSCRVWLVEGKDWQRLWEMSAAAGVPFAVIGHTAEGVAIWRTDSEVPSSIRRPEADELVKILGGTDHER